ncbi:MAG: DUF3108 domain-containing protein [Pseudomonadota bacterium]
MGMKAIKGLVIGSVIGSAIELAIGLALCAAGMALAQAAEHPAVKYAVDLPPPADLSYLIKARQSGFSINGEALISWRVADGKYALLAETRATLLGKVMENRSEGAIDGFGLAPTSFFEKRFRKEPATTTFDRAARSIVFTDGKLTYPLQGGEQDRTSAPWQLVAAARAAPDKFTPGSEWVFFVAGRRDAEPWSFKVIKHEKVQTGIGEVDALHLVKAPPPDSKGQQLDIWLAPGHEWYPVRLRFADKDGEFVDQTLEKIVRK